jgi:hypothetical protein
VRPLARLPDSPSLRREIANHLPSRKHAAIWLQAIAEMIDFADEAAAHWIAREAARDARSMARCIKRDRLRIVALWTWFSMHPGTLAYHFIRRRWTPTIQLDSALDAAEDWRTEIDLHVSLGQELARELWLQPANVWGYDFKPLATTSAIAEEAIAMGNCLRSYGQRLAQNRSSLWSMRRNGQRVATLEVALRYGDPLPNVVQLKGAGNSTAPMEVWWAARRWLHLHDLPQVAQKRLAQLDVPIGHITWTSLWRPYWLAKRRVPEWLPLAPSVMALYGL